MDRISFAKMAVLAIPAALIGSALGTLLFSLWDSFQSTGGGNPFLAIAVAVVSLFGTLPGALLIGVPVLYPIRQNTSQHPLILAAPVAIGAILISLFLFGLALHGRPRDLELITCFSGSTALGFVWALGRWGKGDWCAD